MPANCTQRYSLFKRKYNDIIFCSGHIAEEILHDLWQQYWTMEPNKYNIAKFCDTKRDMNSLITPGPAPNAHWWYLDKRLPQLNQTFHRTRFPRVPWYFRRCCQLLWSLSESNKLLGLAAFLLPARSTAPTASQYYGSVSVPARCETQCYSLYIHM